MCGIFFILLKVNSVSSTENSDSEIIKSLNCMYEKSVLNVNRRGPDYNCSVLKSIEKWHLFLNSSVLWLQGSSLVEQPVETENSLFLYNGDIFDSELTPLKIRTEKGDTRPLLEIIEDLNNLKETLSKIHGPYSFIYIDKANSKLYFARDIYGRRSLLICKDKDKIVLSSVLARNFPAAVIELPALGIYSLDLTSETFSISLYPWTKRNEHFNEKFAELENFLSSKIKLIGIDNLLPLYKSPRENEIDLLHNIETFDDHQAFQFLLSNELWKNNVFKLKSLLKNAIERRVTNQPNFCDKCIKEQQVCPDASIGVLFSGGLDCAVITLLADEFIDKFRPVDLLNVAFEKNGSYETPDRLTAKLTLQELQRLRPERRWNLLEINVTQDELNKERNDRIGDLIFPLQTILDESLGCALWFASRGKTENYTTPCRVLFVGMGADELFGGYTRHRAAFKRGHWEELAKELDKDWNNIAYRNLARDDRVVADHGRQLRTPYLDENIVEYVRSLNPWERCYPSEKVKQGLGDKLLLRTLGYHLGLTKAAVLRKRALQFGSRIANSKENAHDVSPRL